MSPWPLSIHRQDASRGAWRPTHALCCHGLGGGCQRGQALAGPSSGGFVLCPLPWFPVPWQGVENEPSHRHALCPAMLPPALLPVASPSLLSEHCWLLWCRQGSCDLQLTPNSLGQLLVPAALVCMGHFLSRPFLGQTRQAFVSGRVRCKGCVPPATPVVPTSCVYPCLTSLGRDLLPAWPPAPWDNMSGRVVRYWDKLLRVVNTPCLEIFNARLDGAWSHLLWLNVSLPMAKAWNWFIFKAF